MINILKRIKDIFQRRKLAVCKSNTEVAYIYLSGRPRKKTSGIVKKTIQLSEVIENYKGPDVFLDFNMEGELIGLEVLK